MSVTTFDPNAPVGGSGVTVTEAAARYFEKMIASEPGKMVRLSTKASGCTGYAYVLDTVDGPEDSDEVIAVSQALTFLVSEQAKPLVQMTEIDYVKEGINGIIKFNNPNVVNECGCGESFAVTE